VAGSLAAVALLLWGLTQAVTQIAHEERTETISYDATGITTLDVAIDSGSLTVVGTDGDQITVTARISDGLRSTSVRREVVGDRLELRGGCPALLSAFCDVAYTVEMPSRIAVRARLGNHSARVSGVVGDLDLHSSNGRVEARGSGTGTVRLHSDNGNVVGLDLRARTVDAHSDNGDVDLTFAAAPGDVKATSDNGDVTIEVPDDGTSYAVDTGSANGSTAAPVRTDPDSDRRIVARSGNGSVLVTYRTD